MNTRILLAGLGLALAAAGQPRGPQPPPNGRPGAPIDLTGYWVSIVTEDWRFRMIPAPKGDFQGVPLNQAGIRLGNTWDPAKDEAEGNACKSYGAAAIMRVPTRLHITWQDDMTLKIETDAGTQTRLLHFGGTPPANAQPSWQGYSVANWLRPQARSRGGQGQPGAEATGGGSLHVVTTDLKPGYLRKNGAPYSDKTTVTEYFDLLKESDGEQWLIVKTIVTDPTYLQRPFTTSTNFRRQANANGWSPGPCYAK
jgi:hypothetical protein